jgi:cytochrome b
VLSLLLFRLIWGFVGGLWSRFSSFVVGPSTIVRYARGQAALKESVGHNPLGSLSVLALLAFTLLQVVAGLCSDDEIATAGPIAKMLSGTWVGYATYYHTKIGKIILIVLVQLHIAAIIFYRVKHKEDLVTPMLKGDKAMAVTIESSVDSIATRCKAVIVFAICAGLVAGFVQWAG